MAQTIDECRPDRIDSFLAGKLSSADQAELEQHLTRCDACDRTLTRRTADPDFWRDAHKFLSSHDAEEDAPVRLENDLDLKQILDPTDDPQMLGRFAGYEVAGVIGSGGMGVVMKGHDVSLDRFVAIKILHPSLRATSAARQRFSREAQAAAAVVHDNVISIYGVDQWNGVPYLVMPYVKGESLQQRIDRTAPLSIENVLEISLQIARGLSAAHDQGLVHRDIKPANILIPSSVSRIALTDFGLARAVDDASLTRSGIIAGTPQYMSPEQAKGEAVDGRSDLFSLGSIMYAMACGRPPFRADTPFGVLRRITDHPHRELHQVRSDVPRWLERIIDRLLQKEPDRRFQSAKELADHLEDCLAHLRQPTTTVLPKLQSAPMKKQRRLRPIAALVAICGAIAIFAFLFGRPESDKSERTGSSQTTLMVPFDDHHVHAWEFDDSALSQLESDLLQLSEEISKEKNHQTGEKR